MDVALADEVERRRNLAIISHPDAGKTTLTEKLLLYGGAISQAGAVKAKGEQRRATSDFMELEQQRGISISSTVLSYEYDGKQVNVLDTPGHQDFSEDTYRTLAAADNAVMLVDAAKGLEPQTRKLFEVARLRRLPLFTFVNKLDRPSLSPYELIDQIEAEFGISCCPLLWPVGSGDRFRGVLERGARRVHLFARGERGKKAEEAAVVSLDDDRLEALIGDGELYAQLIDDVEMLDGLTDPLDLDRLKRGEQTPVLFGSAMTNFGAQRSWRGGAVPRRRPTPLLAAGAGDEETVEPTSEDFSGFVFKLQANTDPKHRDRIAYVRVCSGRFEKGLKVKHSRLRGQQLTLAQAQTLLGAERSTLDGTSYPGDVVGIPFSPGQMAIGDTLYTGSRRISFAKIPSFSPEIFARCINPTPSKREPHLLPEPPPPPFFLEAYKSFNKGIEQLLNEGAVQQLLERGDTGGGVPILAAVGPLQLEVVSSRLSSEYSVEVQYEMMPQTQARWAMAGWEEVDAVLSERKLLNVKTLEDVYGRPVLLFTSGWTLDNAVAEVGERLQLRPYALAPDVQERRRKK
ncbi:putative mitochondrial elongation factor [Emiliania huxleyi CCMP1516]|uniref:Tr-type G domain-containing protein n=2 Tax=Emiliania huxleyi TaxID=2903 RepID=A0A0D3JGU3_EMIH1|nr:putative mitochondrial elongation factor [Emiliania huxleyi CCMP1516]EOD22728.1 putative mitochondrial elongation factor [Emiliania huxleyi CCMP1516]|eukprot:XP_005775157.1 putative mitochondrial elongation factor [Emiliania huxleyi CCMP1516]